MAYRLLLICYFWMLTAAGWAQTWQLPNPELGVPKPQGPRLPTPSSLLPDPQARTQAHNQALLNEALLHPEGRSGEASAGSGR